MNNKISIILPTYNEKDNIIPLIDEISDSLNEKEFEIVVVDDDSPDGTWKLVEKISKECSNIHLLRRQNKRGLTSALNDGIHKSTGDILVWMDCDFQQPPSVVPKLVEKVESGFDAAIGSRYVGDGKDLRYNQTVNHKKITLIHTYLSVAICRFTAFIFSSNQTDWTSGFIAIRRDLFDRIDLFGDYGEYFMYLIHHLENSGYKLIEIPYVLGVRIHGESKTARGYIGMLVKGTKYVWAVFRLKILDIVYYSIYKKKSKGY